MTRLPPGSRRRASAQVMGALLALFAADAKALCTVTCSCAVSTTNVVFGAINPLSLGNSDTVGGVTVNCGGVAGLLIPFQVDISKGGGASYASRSMAYGSYAMAYNLYQDSAHTTVFGNGTGGTSDFSSSILLSALGLGTPVTVPVYGRVFGGQLTLAPGAYADTISVTLTYY